MGALPVVTFFKMVSTANQKHFAVRVLYLWSNLTEISAGYGINV